MAVPIVVWVLLFAGRLESQAARAVSAGVCVALMLYQLSRYRRSTSGARLVFLSLIVTGFVLASVWLALNVARGYTYTPESVRVWEWHEFIVTIQDALLSAIGALMVVVFVWGLLRFAHWISVHLPSR